MSDKTETPAAVPVHTAPWQPTNDQVIRAQEQAWATRTLAAHDAARAVSPMVTLVAVTAFTIVDDESPDGRVVNMGDTFEVSEFDLPKFYGKGLPPAPTMHNTREG